MTDRLLPLMLAAALAALAGCSGAPAPAAEPALEAPPAGDAAPGLVVHQKDGHLDAGLGAATPTATCWLEVGADRVLEFDVPEGTAVLVLELAWTDGLQDLTMVARPPGSSTAPCSPAEGDSDGWTGSPDPPARLVVADPQPGTWTLGAQANGAVVRTMAYTLYATVAASPLDDAYTAVPA